jgi:hypothetical protein
MNAGRNSGTRFDEFGARAVMLMYTPVFQKENNASIFAAQMKSF